MAIQIAKFHIPRQHARIVLQIPEPIRILACQTQHDQPTIWILHDPGQPWQAHEFRLVGVSGLNGAEEGTYLGTCQLADQITLHVFWMGEVVERVKERDPRYQ